MRTIRDMIKELKKFPLEAKCYGYEGECSGLIVMLDGQFGFIYSEDAKEKDFETETFKNFKNGSKKSVKKSSK